MQYIEIKLTATEYDKVQIAARKSGLSLERYLEEAAKEQCRKALGGAPALFGSASQHSLPVMPAYPAPLGDCFSPPCSGYGDAQRLRQMVAMKRNIDAELIRFAENIIMGQA